VGRHLKDLTDNVNFMASNLTGQVRNIAEVRPAIAAATCSKKITVDVAREILLAQGHLEQMVEQLRSFAAEVTRVAREVGTEGRLGVRPWCPASGPPVWKDLTDNVNLLAGQPDDASSQHRRSYHRVARGDLSRKNHGRCEGEILELKNTINTMVDQLKRSSPAR